MPSAPFTYLFNLISDLVTMNVSDLWIQVHRAYKGGFRMSEELPPTLPSWCWLSWWHTQGGEHMINGRARGAIVCSWCPNKIISASCSLGPWLHQTVGWVERALKVQGAVSGSLTGNQEGEDNVTLNRKSWLAASYATCIYKAMWSTQKYVPVIKT